MDELTIKHTCVICGKRLKAFDKANRCVVDCKQKEVEVKNPSLRDKILAALEEYALSASCDISASATGGLPVWCITARKQGKNLIRFFTTGEGEMLQIEHHNPTWRVWSILTVNPQILSRIKAEVKAILTN